MCFASRLYRRCPWRGDDGRGVVSVAASGGRCCKAADELRVLFFDAACGHSEHDDESQAATKSHLDLAADEVTLEAERDVQAAVDAFDRGALFVEMGPLVCRAGHGAEDAGVFGQLDPHAVVHVTSACLRT